MGATSIFFPATYDELLAAAPGWVKPVYGAMTTQEIRNPFTGEKWAMPKFETLSPPPGPCAEDRLFEIANDRGEGFKLLGGPKLTALMPLLVDAPNEVVMTLHRCAIVGPDDVEHMVSELPPAFVDALADLPEARFTEVCARWRKEAWEDVLGALVRISSAARRDGRCVFVYRSP